MNPAGSMEARRAKLAANSSNFQEVSHTSLTVIVQRLTIDSSLASAWSFQIFLGTQCLKNDRSSDQLISSCWGIDSVTTRRIPSQVMPQCHCLAIHVHTFFKIFCFFHLVVVKVSISRNLGSTTVQYMGYHTFKR